MAARNDPTWRERGRDRQLWALVERQHGVVARRQLLAEGLTPAAIGWRVRTGRLHPVARGVYAVGRPRLGRHGRWMAAVLAGGAKAVLSHGSAAALWGIGDEPPGVVEISTPAGRRCRRAGIRAHRRGVLRADELTMREGIPVTGPVRTLLDQAARLRPMQVERAVNEADKLGLIDPDALRVALERYPGTPGVAPLRRLLDRHTFRLSDSDLELLFRPLARDAGLPAPETKAWVNGYEVDFFWPKLGIVVETDGLRYHRTPSQQTRGLKRDQEHLTVGMWPLRFSHWQVKHEPGHVRKVLRNTVNRAQQTRNDDGPGP